MAAVFRGCSTSSAQFSSWYGQSDALAACRRPQKGQGGGACAAALLRDERSWGLRGLEPSAPRRPTPWPLAAAAPLTVLLQRISRRRRRRWVGGAGGAGAGAAAHRRRGGAARPRGASVRGGFATAAAAAAGPFGGEATCVELDTVTIRRGREDILAEVNLEVPKGARAVVVGPNGCGKTTLLTSITGKSGGVDAGALTVSAASIGWLRQEAVSGSKRTVLDEAKSEMLTTALEQELQAAEAKLVELEGAGEEELREAQAAYEAVSARYEAAEGYAAEGKIATVLQGLGFGPNDFKRPCSELSGGWQMKVALARALLQEPELLLLDEPTNHMDSAAKRWLANHLASGLGEHVTMLLVTHDRSLLEDIRCTHVLEISAKRIVPYNCGSIQDWEGERKSRVAALKKEMDKLEKEIKADVEYHRKWGAKAAHATRAQSRLKRAERSEKQLAELREQCIGLPSVAEVLGKGRGKAPIAPSEQQEGVLPLAGRGKVHLQLPMAPLANNPPTNGVLLSCMDAEVGYAEGPAVLQEVRLELLAGTRMALLGPNGCGKTTLLRTLAGMMQVKSGRYKVGAGNLRKARVRLFTQDLAQDLPADQTPLEYLLGDGAPIMLDYEGARKALGALGLRAEVHKSPIGNLSGGEKARVALAVFTTRPSDVLLLDEPTNHLDGAAVVALSEGLRQHSTGAVVVASHDKAFVDALDVTATATIVRERVGEAAHFQLTAGKPPASATAPSAISKMAAHEVEEEPEPVEEAPVAFVKPGKARHLARVAMYKAEELMKKIEQREEELSEAEEAMNADWSQEKMDGVDKLKQELERMYAKWEKLSEEALLVA